MTVDFDPIAIALQVAREFDALGIAYTIGGSIAGSFAGEPRSTLDIDIVAAVLETHVPLIDVLDLLDRALREASDV